MGPRTTEGLLTPHELSSPRELLLQLIQDDLRVQAWQVGLLLSLERLMGSEMGSPKT